MNSALKGFSVSSHQCDQCLVGRFQHKPAAYFYWVGGQPIALPDMNVLVCDACGNIIYDSFAIQRLEALLGIHNSKLIRDFTRMITDHDGDRQNELLARRARSV